MLGRIVYFIVTFLLLSLFFRLLLSPVFYWLIIIMLIAGMILPLLVKSILFRRYNRTDSKERRREKTHDDAIDVEAEVFDDKNPPR